MKKLIDWMTNIFGPKASKFAKNPWIASIQDTMISIMPIILISSFITILSIFNNFIPKFPDFSFISNYSFGLASIFVAFLVPTFVLEKLKLNKYKRQAGAMGIAVFIMMSMPSFDEAGNIVMEFSRLGSGGMFVAIVAGLLTAFIMKIFSKKSLFKKGTVMPKFLVDSFDSMAPTLVLLFIGYVLINMFGLDLYKLVNIALSPLVNIAQSFGGFVLIMFLMFFFYSFGLSPWLLTPIYYSVGLQAIAINADNVAKGMNATLITTNEVFGGWIWLGGTGCTLVLCVLYLVSAKSEKLKGMGKTTILPSIFNINEPLVFGTIVFNPLLMIPMWICGLVIPAVTYITFSLGLVTIPSSVFQLWYVPIGFQTFLMNHDVRGLILLAVLLALSTIIYYPFFKAYDNQCLKEELEAKQENKLKTN